MNSLMLARQAFAIRLNVRLSVRARLVHILEEEYRKSIGSASGPDVIEAAVFAAQRLAGAGQRLDSMSVEDVRELLREGCPLCAYGSYATLRGLAPNDATPTAPVLEVE